MNVDAFDEGIDRVGENCWVHYARVAPPFFFELKHVTMPGTLWVNADAIAKVYLTDRDEMSLELKDAPGSYFTIANNEQRAKFIEWLDRLSEGRSLTYSGGGAYND